MSHVDRMIWRKFHMHHGDTPPFMGYVGTRDNLAELFAELGYKLGAEIGVQSGLYSRKLLECNPDLKLICIDPWLPFSHHDQAWQDEKYGEFLKNTSGMNVEVIRKPSLEAVNDIADYSLDFAYIDAMHDFDSVMQDIIVWSRKVRKDGIVAGHDFEPYYNCGVPRAVETYATAHNINNYYITAKDPPRTWFWRKP